MAHSFYLLLFGCVFNIFYVPSLIANPIIGGIPDNDHDFKHQVSIHTLGSRTNTFEYICSGTIISERHILTAANCFMTKLDGQLKDVYSPIRKSTKIITGTNKINGPGIERDIIQVFIPKQYDSGSHYADLAVALLSSRLQIAPDSRTMRILPIGYHSRHNYEANKEALFSGFGLHQLQRLPTRKMRPVLGFSPINQVLNVRILPDSECPNYITQICAESSDKLHSRSACLGDSGAGLVFEQNLIGVLSNGPPDCNTIQNPMVFTRISFFKEFIDEAMNKHGYHRNMHVLGAVNTRLIPTPGLQKQNNEGLTATSSSE